MVYSITYSQNYLCQEELLSVEDGLSNRFVRSIIQDHNGFMWFGTKYGLNRYDGYEFKNFTKEKHNLRSNFIHQLYEDADHNVWVGHGINNQSSVYFKAIDILNPTNFDIKPIKQKIKLPFKINELFKIIPHPLTKQLFLTTTKGLVYIYQGKGEFELIYKHPNYTIINSIHIGEQYIWLYCKDELVALNTTNTIVARQKVDGDIDVERSQFIGETQSDKIWLYTLSADHEEKKTRFWKPGDAISNDTVFDVGNSTITGDTWASFKYVDDGYLFYDKDQINLFDTKKSEYHTYRLSDNFIRALFIDNQNNIWIALPGEGLIRLYCQENKFQHFFEGVPLRGITILDEENLLIANNYFNAQSYNFNTYQDSALTISGNELCLSRDGQTLWVSSEKGVIRNVNPQNLNPRSTHTFKESQVKDKNEITTSSMDILWGLYEDSRHRLWVGTSSGIAFMDKGSEHIEILFEYANYPELATAVIYQFYENESGLWIASSKGLYRMNDHRLSKKYATTVEVPHYIPHDHILHLYEDIDGIFWLATKGGGTIRLDTTTGDYRQYTTDEGLSHNVVNAILADQFQYLWMSSDYGLMRFNPENGVVNTFLPRDGIIHEEFNKKSSFQAKDGTLYFGSVSGLISLDPTAFLTEQDQKIPLKIVEYKYFDTKNDILVDATQKLIQEQKIDLDYTNRFFSLSVSLLDYQLNKESQYSYKIEGIDNIWHYITTHNIQINGLAPGQYTLHIRGQGSNGIWSSEELKIPIEIHQPFYLTPSFFGLILLGIGLLSFIYWKWRILRLKRAKNQLECLVQERTIKIEKQAKELKALDTIKSRFFANISHELRTPITLLLAPIEAIIEGHYGKDWEKIKSTLQLVKRNGYKLQNLTEEILTLSALESQKIEVTNVTVKLFDFISGIANGFKMNTTIKHIDFELIYDLDPNLQVFIDKKKVEKIIDNLMSNAIKYTIEKKAITLKITGEPIKDDVFLLNIRVKDQGRGIHAEDIPYIFNRFYQSKQKDTVIEGGSGIGLSIAFEFSKLLGGTLTVKSELGKGSVFDFGFPAKLIDKAIEEKHEEKHEETLILKTEHGLQTRNNAVPDISKKNVLLVEDHDDMLSFISDILIADHNVYTSYNGKHALDFLKKESIYIDLIISDIMMPEMDGLALLNILKSQEKWSNIPIIMLTARADGKDKLKALHLGVDDYLTKPFLPQELRVRTNNLLKNYNKRNLWLQKEGKEVVVSKVDALSIGDLMQDIKMIIKKEINNSQFGVSYLAFQVNLSERQLQRKIRSKTGLSPNQYIRLVKLDMARQYLENKNFETISEVAYKAGFSNVSYFSKIYQTEYGKKPAEYL